MRLAEGTAMDPDARLGVNQEADAAAEEAGGAAAAGNDGEGREELEFSEGNEKKKILIANHQ